jgi:hypothetical protein
MSGALKASCESRRRQLAINHTVAGSPRRAEAESFIGQVFRRHYGARIQHFAPNLLVLEHHGRLAAAAGWRCAGEETLFLECYLDSPIEDAVARIAGCDVRRARIVEVGNLAAELPGSSVDIICALAAHLDRLGFEWVAFTVTRELVGIFRKLGLPLLALAPADPARLGEEAAAWGSYYDTQPVVVAGRIRLALDKGARHG